MSLSWFRKNRKGFTLIELLIVISIIGVLASLLFANFSSARERARDANRKTDFAQIKNALRLYYNDNQSYPNTFSFGATFQSAGGTLYMQSVPEDPLDVAPKQYSYAIGGTTDQFCLRTELENAGDPDAAKSQTRCDASCAAPSSTKSYFVCAE